MLCSLVMVPPQHASFALEWIMSLLDIIRDIIAPPADTRPPSAVSERGPGDADPVHVAACALLLDIGHADGEFNAAEESHLHEVLARHFGLSAEEGRRVLGIAEVERQKAVDHFTFTSIVHRSYDLGQKMVLAEVMWGLVLADGEIADHEHYLTRKISNLLELEPAYLASAKAAAAARVAPRRERQE
jgi:uncharacterized tellurite resistance protein B-like protein